MDTFGYKGYLPDRPNPIQQWLTDLPADYSGYKGVESTPAMRRAEWEAALARQTENPAFLMGSNSPAGASGPQSADIAAFISSYSAQSNPPAPPSSTPNPASSAKVETMGSRSASPRVQPPAPPSKPGSASIQPSSQGIKPWYMAEASFPMGTAEIGPNLLPSSPSQLQLSAAMRPPPQPTQTAAPESLTPMGRKRKKTWLGQALQYLGEDFLAALQSKASGINQTEAETRRIGATTGLIGAQAGNTAADTKMIELKAADLQRMSDLIDRNPEIAVQLYKLPIDQLKLEREKLAAEIEDMKARTAIAGKDQALGWARLGEDRAARREATRLGSLAYALPDVMTNYVEGTGGRPGYWAQAPSPAAVGQARLGAEASLAGRYPPQPRSIPPPTKSQVDAMSKYLTEDEIRAYVQSTLRPGGQPLDLDAALAEGGWNAGR